MIDRNNPTSKLIIGIDGKSVNIVQHFVNHENITNLDKIIILDCCQVLSKGPKRSTTKVKNFDSETFKRVFGLDGDGSTIYACAAQAGESAWVSSSGILSPLTASIADICEDTAQLKTKFDNDFVRVVQDAAGFRGESILHGRIFSLKLVNNDIQDGEFTTDIEMAVPRIPPPLPPPSSDCMSPLTFKVPSLNGSDCDWSPSSFQFEMNEDSSAACMRNHENVIE